MNGRKRPLGDRRGQNRPRRVAASTTGVLLIGLSVFTPAPLLVWNASASVPIGLYRRLPTAPLQRGDFVLAEMPEDVRRLAARRGYLPENIPLLKQVAGVAGDEICANGLTIFVNGRSQAMRRAADRNGRPLPHWNGCRRLGADAVFLLAPEASDSFDGRYFGPVPLTSIIERLAPLWTE